MNEVRPVAEVMAELVAEFEARSSGWTGSPESDVVRSPAGTVEPGRGRSSRCDRCHRRRRRLLQSEVEEALAPAVPRAECAPGSRPETDIQGRVPASGLRAGRVDRGYRCNAGPVAHLGKSGGFKVAPLRRRQGPDLRVLRQHAGLPARRPLQPERTGLGVVVLAMDNPKKPRQTANAHHAGDAEPARVAAAEQEARPARRDPRHRATYPGILDVYDVRPTAGTRSCCRARRAACSGTRAASPRTDGPTGPPARGGTLVAIDLADPAPPLIVVPARRELPRAALLGRRRHHVRRQHRPARPGADPRRGPASTSST